MVAYYLADWQNKTYLMCILIEELYLICIESVELEANQEFTK